MTSSSVYFHGRAKFLSSHWIPGRKIRKENILLCPWWARCFPWKSLFPAPATVEVTLRGNENIVKLARVSRGIYIRNSTRGTLCARSLVGNFSARTKREIAASLSKKREQGRELSRFLECFENTSAGFPKFARYRFRKIPRNWRTFTRKRDTPLTCE